MQNRCLNQPVKCVNSKHSFFALLQNNPTSLGTLAMLSGFFSASFFFPFCLHIYHFFSLQKGTIPILFCQYFIYIYPFTWSNIALLQSSPICKRVNLTPPPFFSLGFISIFGFTQIQFALEFLLYLNF
ncbi:hypothetical protein GDO86_004280 [Hymenochirus boettgeri]|uniref:Uncharacterized protein n=1 Tax=Hymenochirus boettgeri TaxID=247094 RepID=A0A8T2K4I9_9PIPI|nr:hypothetical protein GDO86_004280 [Hymenochirus boettgeri]